ncbi:MAG: ATP-dependent helicase [Chitinophagaceae bacterium]|nr:ATP-dependent helicase [Chitinophagaceae bacterium]
MMTKREQLEQNFLQEYERLNERQRLAVDTIEGPVMVIAGPGTGKTQVLACRIANILLKTDVYPSNILCLTYTEAGVIAMKKRLVSIIGPDGYNVQVHTFHSFCNKVIQENLRLFYATEMEPLSDLERIQIVKQIIDELPSDNPLRRLQGDVYYDAKSLLKLYEAIKKEGWDVEWLVQQTEHYIRHIIPETEGFYNKREKKKGHTVLTEKGKAETERMNRLQYALQTFYTYQQLLQQKKRYDYDDMINWVIDLFEQRNDILLNYQEQFQYILVDEYQDTSGSQNRIVELLISYWQNEKPNLFVVGDDDQSIYRFQGANLINLLMLAEKLGEDLTKIVLTANYRSVQPILDAARHLIENNRQRLVYRFEGLTKELYAADKEKKDLHIPPVLREYENEFAENAHVAKSIRQLIDSGVPPANIAVIYREHKLGDEFIRFLQLLEIPFYVKRSVNLLEDEFIKKIITLMQYVQKEADAPFSGDGLLYEILHFPFFNSQALQIAQLCFEYNHSDKNVSSGTFRQWLNQRMHNTQTSLFSEDHPDREVFETVRMLERMQKELYRLPLQRWFEMLINEAGILQFIMKQDEKYRLMNKLSVFFDYIKSETHKIPSLSLADLLRNLELMKENKLSLELIQTTGTQHGVNLLSCHGSKGLEFEYVFLIGARNDIWEGKSQPHLGFRLPPHIFQMPARTELEEESRRLFYVAITRAEKFLYISWPRMTQEGKELIPSRFVNEIESPLNLNVEKISLTEEENLEFRSLRFGMVQKPVLMSEEKQFLDELLKGFVMNVTALNHYLECPLKFFYNSLVRVPSAKTEAMHYGTAVHKALQDFINTMMSNQKTYPEKDFLIQRFLYHLNKEKELFSTENLQRYTERGEKALTAYYEKYYNPPPGEEFILTEKKLDQVIIEGIPMKGFADKIQFWGNEIVITDFKTGSYEKARKRGEFSRPGEKEIVPQGGNYWRQAVFYKLLVDHLPGKNWKVKYIQFDFVEPENDSLFIERMDIHASDEEQVKKQLTEVWQKIQQHDFYTGCGKEDCYWCRFVKTNKIYSHVLEEETEPQEI